MMVPVPEPVVVIPPGVRVNVQVPIAGKLLNATLPVAREHVGWVIAPTAGTDGLPFTVRVYVAVADAHGKPNGLLVVTVMIIVLPASAGAGV